MNEETILMLCFMMKMKPKRSGDVSCCCYDSCGSIQLSGSKPKNVFFVCCRRFFSWVVFGTSGICCCFLLLLLLMMMTTTCSQSAAAAAAAATTMTTTQDYERLSSLRSWQQQQPSILPDTFHVISLNTACATTTAAATTTATTSPSSTTSNDNDNNNHHHSPAIWKLQGSDKDKNGTDIIILDDIPAVVVPGDLWSDLIRADYIDDPYYNRNFLTQRHVWTGEKETNDTNTKTTIKHKKKKKNDDTTLFVQRTRTWTYSVNVTRTKQPLLQGKSNNNLTTTTMTWLLVLEGVKMGAIISWNGKPLGTVTDQFVRTIFTLPNDDNDNDKDPSPSLLTIRFDPSISTNGRFMACSGGWDWAPYTHTVDGRGSFVGTLGLTAPVYLVPVQYVYIDNVVCHVFYMGNYYPTQPVTKTTTAAATLSQQDLDQRRRRRIADSSFQVQVKVYVQPVRSLPKEEHWFVCVSSCDFGNNETHCIPIPRMLAGSNKTPGIILEQQQQQQIIRVNFTVPLKDIQLWWPNNMGQQPLYHVRVSLVQRRNVTMDDNNNDNDTEGGAHTTSSIIRHTSIQKRIGFRIVQLVTTSSSSSNMNETQEALHQEDGSGRTGMFFRINGADVYCRGANVIPMDFLEGRWSDEAHRILAQSAAAANMNMLRVWGGGAVLPQSFYDACDEYGIMLYHDLMFVGEQNHSAVRKHVVKNEIRHIVRKLSSHPSIVLWSGCNECTYFGGSMDIYDSFVMTTVAQEDDSRAIWPGSPSNYGWESGVDTLTGRPNGNALKSRKSSFHLLEVHGPYHHGYSKTYPGVNGLLTDYTFTTNIPPRFKQETVSSDLPNTFVSEFGASVSSSFESMSAMLPKEAWSLHGGTKPDECYQLYGVCNFCVGSNPMAERNYPCDNLIQSFFGKRESSLDSVGPRSFQRQLYQCMIAQALWMKGQIEMMRSSNSFGTLIWQLNEIWPTGGWGAVEYGSRRNQPQQVLGGRWKPLMFLMKQLLYRDVIVACGEGGKCYVRHDGVNRFPNGLHVQAQAWNLMQTKPINSWTLVIPHENMPMSRTTFISRFKLPDHWSNQAHVVLLDVSENTPHRTKLSDTNAFLWKTPYSLPATLPRITVHWKMGPLTDNSECKRAELNITSDGLALYVVLSTNATGQFDSNAFHLRPNQSKTISFVSVGENETIDVKMLKNTLRVEHLLQSDSTLPTLMGDSRFSQKLLQRLIF